MLYKKLHKRVPEFRMLYVTPEKVGVLPPPPPPPPPPPSLLYEQRPAGHLSSDVGQAETDMLYKKLHKRVPEIRMLYVTPENVGVLSSFPLFVNYAK